MDEHDFEKNYFERFAINLLKEYINLDISNLIKDEEPDWQEKNNCFGIEITRDSIGTKFWADIKNVEGKKICDKDLEKFNKKFKKNGGRILTKENAAIMGITECSFGFNDKYIYIIPSYENDFKRINEIIYNKTKKLNNTYNKLIHDNRLFIFSPILIKDNMYEEELQEIIKIQKNEIRNFNIIYICIFHEIYVFDLIENTVEIISMNEEVHKLSVKSSEEVKMGNVMKNLNK